jgi:hypothetical protein
MHPITLESVYPEEEEEEEKELLNNDKLHPSIVNP